MAVAAATFWLTQPGRVHVNLITEAPYFESEIYLDGQQQLHVDGTPYTTPCTIERLPARVHHVVLRHKGLPGRDLGRINFAETREIVIRPDDE